MGTSASSVRVAWLAVQIPPDGILTGYSVYYSCICSSLSNTSSNGQQIWYMAQTFPPTTTAEVITNLDPNGLHWFTVVAVVTISGQLYSGEVDTALVVNISLIHFSSGSTAVWTSVDALSNTSASYSGGVLEYTLAGGLAAVFVVVMLTTATVIVVRVVILVRKRRCGHAMLVLLVHINKLSDILPMIEPLLFLLGQKISLLMSGKAGSY